MSRGRWGALELHEINRRFCAQQSIKARCTFTTTSSLPSLCREMLAQILTPGEDHLGKHTQFLASVLVLALIAGEMTVDESFNLQNEANDAHLRTMFSRSTCANERFRHPCGALLVNLFPCSAMDLVSGTLVYPHPDDLGLPSPFLPRVTTQ